MLQGGIAQGLYVSAIPPSWLTADNCHPWARQHLRKQPLFYLILQKSFNNSSSSCNNLFIALCVR